MVGGQRNPVLRYLRRLAGAPRGGDQNDQELLRRFAHNRDEDAFTTIVEKYGPMVLGVCRRILQNSQDVEDAFQATFLVLVRKVGSLRQPGSLASWLYGVAYRTALKARALAAQRRFHETQAMNIQVQRQHQEPANTADLKELLEEVNRLPGKYQKALTLCYFAGLTNEEAARSLGCAPGTIFSRLARAREMLRARWARRGFLISTAGLTAALASETARAAASASLVDATVKASLALATGHALAAATVSTTVLTLTKGVQQAMFLNTLKTFLVVALTATVVSGAGVSLWALAQDSKQTEKRAAKQAIASKENLDEKEKLQREKRLDDEEKRLTEIKKKRDAELNLKRLVQERVEVAKKELEARMFQFEAGKGTLDFLIGASKRLVMAELDATDKRPEQISALKAHLERMKKVQDIDQGRYDAGRISIEDLSQSKYYRLESEIWLERAKAGKLKLDIEIRP
jgi:RNA polymerase sigma factor (sigma-70 family)